MRAIHSSLASLLFTVAIGATAGTTDFKDCPQFFANGTPPKVGNVQQLMPRSLCYDAFAILHSGKTKTPVFVAEKLNREQMVDAKGEERHDRFFADSRLPRAERATLDDYRGSGWDRGHLSPAANQPNPQAMAQSFSLANMVPQAPVNNRKAWAGIERATRKYAMRATGDVYVVTGPVFNQFVGELGTGKVRIPSHLYKLVYDASSNRAWAHWLENTDAARVGKPLTYQELVQRTGIDFLPGLTVRN